MRRFITVLSGIVRSLNFRHLIQQVSVFGFILIIPTVSQISILMEKKYRERRHPLKMWADICCVLNLMWHIWLRDQERMRLRFWLLILIRKRLVKEKIRMVLLVVPAIWQVPVGIGCRMCRDVLPELQEMLIWLLQVMLWWKIRGFARNCRLCNKQNYLSLQESRTFLLLRKKWKFPVLFSREILLSPRTFGWKEKKQYSCRWIRAILLH